MTIFSELNGSREKPKLVNLTTDDPTLIMAGPRSGFLTLESLRYSAGGSGADLSLWVTDGTTTSRLLNEKAVPANEGDVITDHVVLWSGTSIMAQASVGLQIEIVAVFILSGEGLTK